MLGGEVSRLPLVTSGVHTSQVGGEVSSWVGYGVVGTRLTRATFEKMRDVNPRRFGGSMFDWNRECRLGVPLLVHLNLSGTQPFLVCWPGWVRFSRSDVHSSLLSSKMVMNLIKMVIFVQSNTCLEINK